MKVASIQSILYAILSVIGFVLLVASVVTDDTVGVILGTGSVILGALGLELQPIQKNTTESREVR